MNLADALSPEARRQLAEEALGCLEGGRWYLVPEEESAPFVREMGPEAEFVPAMDARTPVPHGPRPWLVLDYDSEARSPVAMARPGSAHNRDGRGIPIGSHDGRHEPEEARTCKVRNPNANLIPGCNIPLDVSLLSPERFSCTEPDFERVRARLRDYLAAHAPHGKREVG